MIEFAYLPGEWYVIITCQVCKNRLPIFHDLTCGKGKFNATYTFRCPECGYEGSYEGDAFERYQHPSNGIANHARAVSG